MAERRRKTKTILLDDLDPRTKALKRTDVKRKILAHTSAMAGVLIGPLKHGCEIFGLNCGQFSFINILEHCLNEIGPAHCVVATWTAAGADIKRAKVFCNKAELLSMKWLIDRSFKSRQPELCAILQDNFGAESIRTASSHAKFMLLYNDDWNLVIRTSMNLNMNKRIEDFEISDDPVFLKYMLDLVDAVFETTDKSDVFSKKDELNHIANQMKDTDVWKNRPKHLNLKPRSSRVEPRSLELSPRRSKLLPNESLKRDSLMNS
jgi:hypothetical protein